MSKGSGNVAVIDEQLAALFFAESEELLASANEALLTAEAAGKPEDSVAVLFRAFHSIKGGAMSLDFGDLSELAHRLEDLLDLARQEALVIDGHVINLIFSSIDIMEGLLQVYGNKACKTEGGNSARLALMEEIALVVEGKKTEIFAGEHTATADGTPATSIDPSKRLVYCEVRLEPDTDMPEIRMMLVLKRLEEIGQVVYSHPDQVGLMMGPYADERMMKAIIATDLCDAEVAKALNISSVAGRRVLDVTTGRQHKPDLCWPTVESICVFQNLVNQLTGSLAEGVDSSQAGPLSEKLLRWGEAEGMVNGWYPGGLEAWQGLAGMLADSCVKLILEQQDNSDRLRQAMAGLCGLWHSVFNVLNGIRYYLSFEPEDISLGMCLGAINAQVRENKEVRMVLLDVTGVLTMETGDVQAFVNLRKGLALHGVKLALFAGGHSGRSHYNVLEALSEATGGIVSRSTAFEAGWRK
jgi:two-component system chemotaxis sensor kinase CheA